MSTVTAAQASFIQPTSAKPSTPDLTNPDLTTQALTTQALTTQALTTPASNSVDPKFLHVLNRLSFGPRPGDLERLQAIGIDRYIQEQLFPERIPEPPDLQQQISQLQTLQASPLALIQAYQAQQGQLPFPRDHLTAPRNAPVWLPHARWLQKYPRRLAQSRCHSPARIPIPPETRPVIRT